MIISNSLFIFILHHYLALFLQFTYCIEIMSHVAFLGKESLLPCNISGEHKDDPIILILWYRNDSVRPIYTVDARSSSLMAATHSVEDSLASRITFSLNFPISHLYIRQITQEDEAEYRCRIDYRLGRTVNRSVRLSVLVPMQNLIIKDHENNVIDKIAGPYNEDSSVQLICQVEGGKDATYRGGNPPPKINWWKGSEMVESSFFLSSSPFQASSASSSVFASSKRLVRNVLTLTPTREDLMSSLTCKAFNSNQTSSMEKTIKLDVNLKPKRVEILNKPSQVSAERIIELVCQSTGSKPPATIRWIKRGQQLQLATENISEDGYVTTSFLSMVAGIDDHHKDLFCTSFNPSISSFTLNDSVTLNVNYVPVLSLVMGASIQQEGIPEGSNVFFECNIQANPTPFRIGWTFNGVPLTSSTNQSSIMVSNETLLIKYVNRSFNGEYQCWAENSEGHGKSSTRMLIVQYAPECVPNQPIFYAIGQHQTASINCSLVAEPQSVIFKWTFSGSLGPNRSDLMSFSDGLFSRIEYTINGPSDYGVLSCLAMNSVGLQKEPCRYHIIPPGPPDPVSNCTIINSTANTLTVDCKPGFDHGLVQIFHLEAYTEFNSVRKLLYNLTSTDEPYFLIKTLPPKVDLLLMVYASNEKGRSRYLTLNGSTLMASKWHTEDQDALSIKPVLIIVVIIALIFAALVVQSVLMIRLRNQRHESVVQAEHLKGHLEMDESRQSELSSCVTLDNLRREICSPNSLPCSDMFIKAHVESSLVRKLSSPMDTLDGHSNGCSHDSPRCFQPELPDGMHQLYGHPLDAHSPDNRTKLLNSSDTGKYNHLVNSYTQCSCFPETDDSMITISNHVNFFHPN